MASSSVQRTFLPACWLPDWDYRRLAFEANEQPLECSEAEKDLIDEDAATRRRILKALPTMSRITMYSIATMALLLLLVLVPLARRLGQRPYVWSSCGSDPETARSRGCGFDTISFTWQTRECFDEALVAEFAELHPWPFWTSAHGNESVSHDIAYRGEQSLFTSWEHHMMHCVYQFRKMQRAYEAGWIDESLRKYEHTVHCGDYLHRSGEVQEGGRVFAVGNDTYLTYLNIYYPVCERIRTPSLGSGWWEGQQPPRRADA